MWDTKAIIGWLQTIGVTIPLHDGAGYVPNMPDLMGVVTAIAGAGLSMEGAADTPGFQLRIRGRQNDPASAQTAAKNADKAILNADFPAMVDDTQLLWVTRSGGAPAPLGPRPDKAQSTEYVCTYLTTVLEAQ